MNKTRVLPNKKGTYKYFQPVLTNNTMVVSAKMEDGLDDTLDKNKVYKYKVNLSELNSVEDNENTTINKEDEINNDVIENIRNQIQKEIAQEQSEELDNQEDSMDELDEIINIDDISEEADFEDITDLDAEDVFKESKEIKDEEISNISEEIKDEEISNIPEEIKDESVNNNNITRELEEKSKVEDVTTKMDLPLLSRENKEKSMPYRKDVPDNMKDFKVKLFLLATNAKNPVRILVNRKRFLIGSDFEQMDCVIRNNKYVSRCHARIHYESDCYFIEDAGSMNGTYINGVKLAEGLKYKLMPGDIINLADCKFEVSMK